MSKDPLLEPDRKAYLIQNMMVSKYIVAQQRRMQQSGQAAAAAAAAAADVPAEPPKAGLIAPAAVPSFGAPSAVDAAPSGVGGAAASQAVLAPAAEVPLGCKHYKRKCKLIAPCCKQAFTCRLCHDEEVSSHRMVRGCGRSTYFFLLHNTNLTTCRSHRQALRQDLVKRRDKP